MQKQNWSRRCPEDIGLGKFQDSRYQKGELEFSEAEIQIDSDIFWLKNFEYLNPIAEEKFAKTSKLSFYKKPFSAMIPCEIDKNLALAELDRQQSTIT